MDKTVAVGKFFKPFGVKGEIRFQPYFPDNLPPSLIKGGTAINTQRPDDRLPVVITSFREMSKFFTLTIKGYSAPETVSRLTNMELFVDRTEIPELPEGEYLTNELIGLTVVTEDGEEIGLIKDVIETGANSVIDLKLKKGGETMLPFINEVVLSVDMEKEVMTVRLMEGLIDEN